MPTFAVILPAAGNSTRFGGSIKKPFLNLGGKPIWQRTLELFHKLNLVEQIVLVLAPDELDEFRQKYAGLFMLAFDKVTLAPGGAERFDSVANGLSCLTDDISYVAVHDVVRALTEPALIEKVFAEAVRVGGAMAALPVVDTLKRVDASSKLITETLPRAGLFHAQTPQAFRRDILEAAYQNRHNMTGTITDDAQLVEAIGANVGVVPGSPLNFKITTAADLKLAEALLAPAPVVPEKPRFFRDELD